MHRDEYEELFSDGWRDPSDGGRRGMFYLLAVFGLLAGFGLLVLSIVCFARPEILGGRSLQSDRILSTFLLIIGSAISISSFMFLRSEWKYLEKGKVTAERVVFAGFATSVAIVCLAGESLQLHPSGKNPLPATAILLLIATGVFLLSLTIGLVCAYWPKLAARKQRLNAVVDQRFGIDEVQNWIEDPACPEVDRLVPVVRIRLSDGETLTLRCDNTTYYVAMPGSFGIATVAGKRLLTFSRKG